MLGACIFIFVTCFSSKTIFAFDVYCDGVDEVIVLTAPIKIGRDAQLGQDGNFF